VAASTVTVSIGAATMSPAHPFAGPDELVRAADQTLYRAKQTGRNRVCTAEEREPARRSA
jgi:diguanylate cyclase (GGDEF)-like protein